MSVAVDVVCIGHLEFVELQTTVCAVATGYGAKLCP